jgi:hypothetical protein
MNRWRASKEKLTSKTKVGRRWDGVLDAIGLFARWKTIPVKRELRLLQAQLSSVASAKAPLWRAPPGVVEPKDEPPSAAPLARPAPMRKPESGPKLAGMLSPNTDKTKRPVAHLLRYMPAAAAHFALPTLVLASTLTERRHCGS